MSDLIDCPQHGSTPYCLICVHLRSGSGLEYFATAACLHGPAQAWCAACHAVLASRRGWDDLAEAQADFNLFCTGCYKAALRHHSFVAYSQGSDDDCDWGDLDAPDV
jgi:hypothetical protein